MLHSSVQLVQGLQELELNVLARFLANLSVVRGECELHLRRRAYRSRDKYVRYPKR